MILLAGLSGGNDTLYISHAIDEATQRGFKCVVIGFRGTSGVPLTTPKPYTGSQTDDIREPI